MDQYVFDPFSTAVRDENPYVIYKILRDETPFYYDDRWNLWVVSRFEDVFHALRDWETFSQEPDVDIDGFMVDLLEPRGNILVMDPPRHDELRSFINATKVFTNRSMRDMEPAIGAVIDRLIDGFADNGSADLVQDFAYQLPLQVGPVLIGFPEEDIPLIDSWHRPTQVRTPGVRGIPQEAFEGGAKIRAYIDDLVADRRESPRDDLVSIIAESSLRGEMTADEASGLTFILFEASIDTTSGLLSNAFYHLAKQPDQRQILLDDPSVIPNAVEEFLRFDDPVQFNARTLTRDFELHGQKAAAGDRVILLFGSANRDEREFTEPDRLDVTRDAKRHLGFGTGIHLCIGAPLARMESKLALERILARIPDYELDGEPERIVKQNLRGFQHLPIRF